MRTKITIAFMLICVSINAQNSDTHLKTKAVPLYSKTLEIGGGLAAGMFDASINNSNNILYQANFRRMHALGVKRQFYYGYQASCVSTSSFSNYQRFSINAVLQPLLATFENGTVYFDFIGGVAYIPHLVKTQKNWGEKNVLPNYHIGIGTKWYFKGFNAGYFIDAGIGGSYLVNIGLFWY